MIAGVLYRFRGDVYLPRVSRGEETSDEEARRTSSSAEMTAIAFQQPTRGFCAIWTGLVVNRVAGGKLVEQWHEFDGVGLRQQLGAIPGP